MKKAISVLLIALLALGSLTLTACGPAGLTYITVGELKSSEKEELAAIKDKLSYLTPPDKDQSEDAEDDDDYDSDDDDEEEATEAPTIGDDAVICILTADAAGEIEVLSEYKEAPVVLVTAQKGALENVTSLTIPDSVKYLENIGGDGESSALESLSLPSGARMKNCFCGCSALKTVDLPETDEMISCFNNGGGIETAKTAGCKNASGSFNDCPALKELTFRGVKELNTSFNNAPALETVTLSCTYEWGTVTEVEDCFEDCPAVKTVTVTNINTLKSSFDKCPSLTTLIFNGTDTTTYVGDCFPDCSALKTVDFTGLGSTGNALNHCSVLESVDMTATFELNESFEDCPKLRTVNAPSLNYCYDSFIDCPLIGSVELKDMKAVKRSFKNTTGLKSVTVSADKEYGLVIEDAFLTCEALTGVTLSGDVENITDSFKDCKALKTVKYDKIEDMSGSFEGCPALKTKIKTEKQKEEEERKRKEAEEKKRQEEERKKREEEERKRQEELDNEPYGPGTSGLYLKADDDMSACFRLVRVNGSTQFKVFLSPGETTTEYFPSGRYVLKVAEGKEWISDTKAFGKEGHYSSTEMYTFEDNAVYQITGGTRGDFYSDSAEGFLGE